MFMVLWLVSIVATVVIADQKKKNVLVYLLLALATGPLALLIIALVAGSSTAPANNLHDAVQELNSLKSSMITLQQRINNLEQALRRTSDQAVPTEQSPAKPTMVEMSHMNIPQISVAKKTAGPSDMELDFGRNWLNKIGILVFTLGMGFLISYTFKYFGPMVKILFGYAVAGAFFFFGFKLEGQEKLANFGRGLLGGAWALVYFTTYAAHHFAASRIIHNEYVAFLLLALVVVGMIIHVLKYKSEGMMAVALFVAYMTATLGQITNFTFISCLLLAVMVLVLVYKFQWVKTFVLSLILTYGIHVVWIMPRIAHSARHGEFLGVATPDYYLWVNFVFLTGYWLVFLIGSHIANTVNEPKLKETLAAANFGNIALYNVVTYPIIMQLFYSQRFMFMFLAGLLYLTIALWMKYRGEEKFFLSNVVAAIFALTFSVTLKFQDMASLLIWFMEIPFLLYISMQFKEKIYRYLAYGLTFAVVLRSLFVGWLAPVEMWGFVLTGREYLYLWSGFAMVVCFYLTQRMVKNKEGEAIDWSFDRIFPALAFVYLSAFLLSVVKNPWDSLALSVEGAALILLSAGMSIKRFRTYAYIIFVCAFLAFEFENFHYRAAFLKWFIMCADILLFFGAYVILKLIKHCHKQAEIYEGEEALMLGASLLFFGCAVFQYVPSAWISLSLGGAGVLLIVTGILRQDKMERLGGLALLAMTLVRVIGVDLSGLDIIFKIITFIVLGMLFLGASYVYNRFSNEKN